MSRIKLIGELLSVLERREARLLEWGFLDASFSALEVIDVFRNADRVLVDELDKWLAEISAELLVDNLAESGLLVRVGDRYRSRFAETIRLFGRLRQRFSMDDWATAPHLISDLKIHLAPRKYPRRNIPAIDVWGQISSACWSEPVQHLVFKALTKTGDQELEFSGFQIRATHRLLSNYRPKSQSTGTVISAGTGSGKTKAFYLPAFMGIAADLEQDDRSYTKVLAIYPRNVLLADQLTEAVAQAKLLLNLTPKVKRPITFGAFLGDTPYSDNLRQGQFALKNWKQKPLGWTPPFIKNPDTGSDLIWLDKDRIAGRTTLRKADNIDAIAIPDGMMLLTRESIRQNPPDVLMMSLEMLNKEISSPENFAMLGFQPNVPPPRLVLLDEVHTYEGISGAQVPWILRRWTYWVRRWRQSEANPHFVGLSATLKEATSHLSILAGTPEIGVVEIKPEESLEELEYEGIEYNVALKSHAGSGASVLATSIQSAMLGARVLTPLAAEKCNRSAIPEDLAPQCFFGRKVFGFTDNLDSLNRWMADFVDAERNRRLAKFRATAGATDLEARSIEGQVWKLSETLGHDLTQGLSISRCSSQDPGVDSGSDVVLATSSLEVGYDDPTVGMVLHHKSPRSAASFLQRKGRAGRERGIRPWTMVVLSDFGRDRWAFRDSERIFQPELDALAVPALNPYVVRVQATQFLIDWIGNKVQRGEPYRYLVKPDPNILPIAKKLLNELITSDSRRSEFIRDFNYWMRGGAAGLRLTNHESLADSVLWDPPRAILRHAVPELAKILAGEFKPLGASVATEYRRPLPQFIPHATFGELGAQDVQIVFDDSREPIQEDVSIALREAIPCRVSRRHAISVRQNSLWLEASESIYTKGTSSISIAELFPKSFAVGTVSGINIFQPLEMKLVRVQNDVKDSSSGNWNWDFHADFIGRNERLGLADGPVLSRIFSSCNGYFHRRYARADVTRFASQFEYEVVLERGVKKRGVVDLVSDLLDGGQTQQAIGYRRSVDAIRLTIGADHIAIRPLIDGQALQRLRPHYFRYRLCQSPILRSAASTFGIGALWSSSIAMLTATAILKKTDLKSAAALLGDRGRAARKVFECMLQGEAAADLNDTSGGGGGPAPSRRIKEVEELWQQANIKEEVLRLEETLWDSELKGMDSWLTEAYLETMASAIAQAIWTVLPEIPENDISVDVRKEQEGYELVVSEQASGGVGHLERLVMEMGNSPERFDAAFEAALRNCENERVGSLILASVAQAKGNSNHISDAFEQVRSAVSFLNLESAKQELVASLSENGLANDRPAVSALVSKVLRPGSSRETDAWVRTLSRRRANLSNRIGISIDPRVFAYWAVQSNSMKRRMDIYLRKIGSQVPSPDQIFNSFAQLTVHMCRDSCPECLGIGREMDGIVPSRWLAITWATLDAVDRHIDVEADPVWRVTLSNSLRDASRIKVSFLASSRMEVAKVLSGLLAEEHDRGYIFSPFTITSSTRSANRWEVTLLPSGQIVERV